MKLTNAATEAVNGILQLVKPMARGFRNFSYFRITTYLKAGGLQHDIPHFKPIQIVEAAQFFIARQ